MSFDILGNNYINPKILFKISIDLLVNKKNSYYKNSNVKLFNVAIFIF